jgi:colanic acid/amylovoran biosynthesis glycosyltransferase
MIAKENDIQYTIIGDGERRELIETTIAEHGLEDIVELRGWQPQSVVADEMADAHLFILPSVTAENGDKEGTPTVLLEAQSMGLPVVSTYHAGIPEIVEDGETGLLVPERDSEALADALETLISNPERWPEMGKRGREHIERNHSIEAVTDDLLKLYRSLL